MFCLVSRAVPASAQVRAARWKFNDNLHGFQRAGVPVVGISADDAASHRAFREKYGLRFPLLSDLDHQGAVQRAWYNVKADGHAEKVLAEATA